MNKGDKIKTIVVAALLAASITGLSVYAMQSHTTPEAVPVKKTTAQEKQDTKVIIETKSSEKEVQKEEAEELKPIRPVPVKQKAEVVKVDGKTNTGTEDSTGSGDGAEEPEGTGEELEGTENAATPGDDSGSTDGTEQDSEADIPLGGPEVVEEPVDITDDNDTYVPEEPTVVEEPAPEEPPVEEEPVVEEPVEQSTDDGWIYYSSGSRITHYCWCASCNSWAYQPTASGAMPTAFYTCAAGSDLPFGTQVMINGNVYVVEDRGVGPDQFDIFVGEDHQLALDMGMYYAEVWIRFPEQ